MKRNLLFLLAVASVSACNTNKAGDGNDPSTDPGQVTGAQTPGGGGTNKPGGGNDTNNTGTTPGATSGDGSGGGGSVGATVGPINGTTFPAGPSLAPSSPYVHYIGRVEQGAPGGVRLAWPGTGVTVRVTGATSITASMLPAQYVENNVVGVLVDGKATGQFNISDNKTTYNITLSAGDHVVTLYKRTEAGNGMVLLSNLATDGQFEKLATPNGRLIEIIGENAAAGYSADAPAGKTACSQPVNSVADPAVQNVANTFGVMAAQAFGADWSVLAWSGRGLVQNYDGSRGTGVATMYPRLNPQDATSTITSPIGAGVVVINLGVNDINYWLQNTKGVQPDLAGFQAGYLALLKQVRALNPNAAIIATTGPTLSNYQCFGGNPNSGYACSSGGSQPVLTAQVNAIQAALAAFGDAKTSYLAFAPDSTNVAACYMPSAAGHAIMANALVPAVAAATGWSASGAAVAQPAAAPAGTGPKALSGTFVKRPDPVNDPNSARMKVTIDEFPQCHYCSPQAYNANNVGTAACPTLVGINEPCEGYCHEPDGFSPLYHTIPPTSGNHYSDPKPQGFYTAAVPRGRLVHSMEHGAVAITYNCPDGCTAEVAWLQSLYNKYPGVGTTAWLVVSPDPLLTGAKFAAASWTWRTTFNALDDAAKASLECFALQHSFYGRECPASSTNPADISGYPRNCPPILDQYMSTTGG